jgi:predicted GNAT family acetyltransferase
MEHVLDNPAWHALLTGNQALAQGTDQAKYFPADVSPFVGLRTNNAAGLRALHAVLPHAGPCGIISAIEMEVPAGWRVLRQVPVPQLVCAQPTRAARPDLPVQPLGPEHVPAMLALTRLTNPGPFLPRTIALGHYEGIFEGEELVAMAGQRLHPAPYAEISAVCTHPTHGGRGLATQLLLRQVARIRAAGGTPFLHVRHDNTPAIRLYETLGFVRRRDMHIYFLQKS